MALSHTLGLWTNDLLFVSRSSVMKLQSCRGHYRCAILQQGHTFDPQLVKVKYFRAYTNNIILLFKKQKIWGVFAICLGKILNKHFICNLLITQGIGCSHEVVYFVKASCFMLFMGQPKPTWPQGPTSSLYLSHCYLEAASMFQCDHHPGTTLIMGMISKLLIRTLTRSRCDLAFHCLTFVNAQ